MRRNSFERFYLTKVALGDCCGDAERVINMYDIDRARAERHLSKPGRPLGLRAFLKRVALSLARAMRLRA